MPIKRSDKITSVKRLPTGKFAELLTHPMHPWPAILFPENHEPDWLRRGNAFFKHRAENTINIFACLRILEPLFWQSLKGVSLNLARLFSRGVASPSKDHWQPVFTPKSNSLAMTTLNQFSRSHSPQEGAKEIHTVQLFQGSSLSVESRHLQGHSGGKPQFLVPASCFQPSVLPATGRTENLVNIAGKSAPPVALQPLSTFILQSLLEKPFSQTGPSPENLPSDHFFSHEEARSFSKMDHFGAWKPVRNFRKNLPPHTAFISDQPGKPSLFSPNGLIQIFRQESSENLVRGTLQRPFDHLSGKPSTETAPILLNRDTRNPSPPGLKKAAELPNDYLKSLRSSSGKSDSENHPFTASNLWGSDQNHWTRDIFNPRRNAEQSLYANRNDSAVFRPVRAFGNSDSLPIPLNEGSHKAVMASFGRGVHLTKRASLGIESGRRPIFGAVIGKHGVSKRRFSTTSHNNFTGDHFIRETQKVIHQSTENTRFNTDDVIFRMNDLARALNDHRQRLRQLQIEFARFGHVQETLHKAKPRNTPPNISRSSLRM
jgi:hypothetical protein